MRTMTEQMNKSRISGRNVFDNSCLNTSQSFDNSLEHGKKLQELITSLNKVKMNAERDVN